MMPHLPADVLGQILAGYRQAITLDFSNYDQRGLALMWVTVANEFLEGLTRADFETDERANILVGAIGEVLTKLND